VVVVGTVGAPLHAADGAPKPEEAVTDGTNRQTIIQRGPDNQKTVRQRGAHNDLTLIYIPIHPFDGLSATGGNIILQDLEAIYKGFNQHVSSKRDDSKAEWVQRKRSLGKAPDNEDSAINAMENAFASIFWLSSNLSTAS
jgi:hypothetical protein